MPAPENGEEQKAGTAARSTPAPPKPAPSRQSVPDITELFDEDDSRDEFEAFDAAAPDSSDAPASSAGATPDAPSSVETAPPASAAPSPATGGPQKTEVPHSAKIYMQCPNCGLVVRGLPDVFAQPIRCPDCEVKDSFKPEAQPRSAVTAPPEGPIWKKLPFILGVGLAAIIVISLAALAYSRHRSRSIDPDGVLTKPLPAEPKKAEEKAEGDSPAEPSKAEDKAEGDSPAEDQKAETVP